MQKRYIDLEAIKRRGPEWYAVRPIPPKLIADLQKIQVRQPITPMQLRVLKLMANGYDNPEIARILFVGVETVKQHLRVMYPRIGARNRTHAVALGFANGWLTKEDVI